MKLLCTCVLLFLVFLESYQALTVKFGESDFNIREGEAPLEISLTAVGQMGFEDKVVLKLAPMSLQEYMAMNRTLPGGVKPDEDPAEPDLDYNSTVQYVTIRGGVTNHFSANIEINKDNISEMDEVFLVVILGIIEGSVPVDLHQDTAIVTIHEGLNSRAIARLTPTTISAEEGNDTSIVLFLEIDRPIEPTVQFRFSITSDDIMIEEKTLTVSTEDGLRIPVSLQVVDDMIAELGDCSRLYLEAVQSYRSVYTIDHYYRFATICIKDNDIPIIGFEMDGEVVDDPVEIMEGETKELCVSLVNLAKTEVFIEASVVLSPDSPTDVISYEETRKFFFFETNTIGCFDVSAQNDSKITSPTVITFNLATRYLNESSWETDGGYLVTESAVLVVRDNDGIPAMPRDIDFKFNRNQIRITWEIDESVLQPVDKFLVIVEATPTQSIPQSRNRRQLSSPSLPRPECMKTSLSNIDRWECETESNSLTLSIEEDVPDKTYTVSVCAINHLGQECSTPEEMTEPVATEEMTEPVANKPESLAAAGLMEPVTRKKEISRPLVLAIAVVIPLMLLILCISVLCAVTICKYCSVSKSYYPARQGIFQEKIVLGSVDFVETKYCRRPSSTDSSLSMEWTLYEPKKIGGNSPTTSSSSPSHILGTPV